MSYEHSKFIPSWLMASCTALALGTTGMASAETTLPPISVFSSFPGDEVQSLCQIAEQYHCAEDFIDPMALYAAVELPNYFLKTGASEDGYDYELLIANTLVSSAGDESVTDSQIITEFDVTWRGIVLGSYQYADTFNQQQVTTLSIADYTERLVSQFIEDAKQAEIFTAGFLYDKLQASDYHADLKLPQVISAFELYDMQLYHDPLQGAVARYSHPQYPGDVIDIFVYPVFIPDESNPDPQIQITHELRKEIDDIELITASRNIQGVTIGQIKAIDWQTEQRHFRGMYFDVEAMDDDGEPMFTTTYLFQSKDKFIKFSANFPGRVAESMVKGALPTIEVPEQSQLMRMLRQPQS
ncbi:hypothetical protein QTP81_03650 [Alteromonas sp. ASW11-36]|uniref:Uncharacterized protein n=1 Tax=Alteromonas arenosi TaxID=3055817 RepID=A0ABT7SU29_9ALTE|nr:hypothetical protein [Alteromonas sp. ASW11-36]MDM7859703.1 hypothetical protein [Alteromonas sp. ASW11-36]